ELTRPADRLEAPSDALDKAEIAAADEFLTTIEEMTMIEKYYTPEQLEYLRKRREEAGEAGEERIRQGPALWADLIAAFRAEMEKGTDPADPKVQALEKRRQGLVNEFTGGDPGIEQSLK